MANAEPNLYRLIKAGVWLAGEQLYREGKKGLEQVEYEAAVCPCTCHSKMNGREKCTDAPWKAVTIPIQCKVTQQLKEYHSPNFALFFFTGQVESWNLWTQQSTTEKKMLRLAQGKESEQSLFRILSCCERIAKEPWITSPKALFKEVGKWELIFLQVF